MRAARLLIVMAAMGMRSSAPERIDFDVSDRQRPRREPAIEVGWCGSESLTAGELVRKSRQWRRARRTHRHKRK